MRIEPTGAALGARITGLDARDVGADDAAALRQAFLDYHVLVVEADPLTDDELVAFGAVFGPIEKARRMSALATRPEIMVISNIREQGKAVGALPDGELSFHFDRVHQKVPNKAGVLQAFELPGAGGDTLFASMRRAWEALPAAVQERIAPLSALNTYEYGRTQAADKNLSAETPSAVHPVVRTIPETGRRAMFVCRLMTDRILDLPEDESRRLLDTLCDQAEKPDFQYAHRWTRGDIVVWDNRCTTHARTDFDSSQRRLMKRVTVGDTVPPQR